MNTIHFFASTVALALVACSNNPGSGDSGTDSGTGSDVQQAGDSAPPKCDPSSCASGHCAPDGGCAAGCSGGGSCASNETCCNNTFCSNLAKDPQNCGACGTACGGTQFCSGTGCFDAVVMNVCKNSAGTVVLDNLALDEDAGGVIGTAMSGGGGCSGLQITSITQGQNGSMDPTSGRPLLGPGDTYIAAGGGFGQKAVSYMNGARNAPVYTVDDSTNISFLRTSDNSTIIQSPISALTAHHDYFLVYAAAEPVSGTLVFAVYGLYGPGTAAGAFWFKTQVATGLSNFSKQYYVFQWDDTDNDGVPSAGDTFKQLDAN